MRTPRTFRIISVATVIRDSIATEFSARRDPHSRNRISQVCTAHRDVRQFSTPWQVNICMLIRLRDSRRAQRARRRGRWHGTIDGGRKTRATI